MTMRYKSLGLAFSVGLVALLALGASAVLGPETPASASGASLPCTTGVGGPSAWVARAPVPSGVEGATGVIIGGKIYVTHGYIGLDTNITQIYDIASNTWDPPGANAAVSRSELAGVCAIEDGVPKVFAIGGRGIALGSVEVYDPGANTWTPRANMPAGPRGGLGATYVPTLGAQGTIFAIGGRTGGVPHSGPCVASNEAYDVATGLWAARAPLPTPMGDVYSTIWHPGTGLIYVIGGFDCATGSVSTLVQRYDPAANVWLAPGAPMPTARSNSIAGMCGGDIYVIGGLDIGTANRAEVEKYAPVANTWSPAPPLPSGRSEMASTAISTGLDIYAIGSGAFGLAGNSHDRFQCEAKEPTPTSTATLTSTPRPPTPTPVPPTVVGGFSVDPALIPPDGGDAGWLLAGAIAGGLAAAILAGAAWRVRRRWQG